MECLDYKNNVMHMDGVNLKELASKYGTPLYVYSKKYLEDRFDQFNSAITDKELLVCYAVKANSNIAILQLMAKKGAGFDIVSCGELSRVIKAGGDRRFASGGILATFVTAESVHTSGPRVPSSRNYPERHHESTGLVEGNVCKSEKCRKSHTG